MRWKDALWLAWDTETTGFAAGRDRVIELGAVRFLGGEPGPRLGMFFNPGRAIPPAATAVHKITNADVAAAPPLASVWPRIDRHFAEVSVLVGYNIAFDWRFMMAEPGIDFAAATENALILDPFQWIKAANALPYGSRKLGDACKHFGVDLPEEGAHSASVDALATGELLAAIAD